MSLHVVLLKWHALDQIGVKSEQAKIVTIGGRGHVYHLKIQPIPQNFTNFLMVIAK